MSDEQQPEAEKKIDPWDGVREDLGRVSSGLGILAGEFERIRSVFAASGANVRDLAADVARLNRSIREAARVAGGPYRDTPPDVEPIDVGEEAPWATLALMVPATCSAETRRRFTEEAKALATPRLGAHELRLIGDALKQARKTSYGDRGEDIHRLEGHVASVLALLSRYEPRDDPE